MASKSVVGAATGAGIGSAILPGIGSAVGAAVGFVVGLFGSKKHYHVYYFEESTDQWVFVMDGIPSQIKPVMNEYKSRGIAIVSVRNKDAKYNAGELAPKNPPSGYQKNSALQSTNWIVVFLVGGTIGLVYFLIRKRRK